MLRKLLHRRWVGAALLAGPVSLLAQPDSATTRIVPLWRDGQLVTRISGDPNVAGAPFVIRIWNFDNQIVLPHTHPEDEHIVVVQGTWFLTEGEHFDRARLRPLAVGDYALVPRRQAHFAWSKGMTVIQVHGIGPFRVDYVDSVFVQTGSSAIVRVRDSRRPLSPPEVASHFRYRRRYGGRGADVGDRPRGSRLGRQPCRAIHHRAARRATEFARRGRGASAPADRGILTTPPNAILAERRPRPRRARRRRMRSA